MERKIAALFVITGGVYYNLPDVDPWDEARDARLYKGPYPIVAHPPCNRWSQMNRVNAARWGYKMGEDGGLFAFALASVRHYGGVLEHPAESLAFHTFGIPRPQMGSWQQYAEGEYITEVRQAAYGHRATKRTWLLFCGPQPMSLDWRSVRGTHQIGRFDVTLPILPKRECNITPIPFRNVLIQLARSVYDKPQS